MLASIRGMAALIWGLDVFPQGVTCCNYTRRVLDDFGFLVYVIDFGGLRVDRLGRSVMGAGVTETEAVLVSGFLPRKVVASPRLFYDFFRTFRLEMTVSWPNWRVRQDDYCGASRPARSPNRGSRGPKREFGSCPRSLPDLSVPDLSPISLTSASSSIYRLRDDISSPSPFHLPGKRASKSSKALS